MKMIEQYAPKNVVYIDKSVIDNSIPIEWGWVKRCAKVPPEKSPENAMQDKASLLKIKFLTS